MSLKRTAIALCTAFLTSAAFGSSYAASTGIRPVMQAVVTCVYDMVRASPGVLSTEVYDVKDPVEHKYVIKYKFEEMGRTFVGGMGIVDYIPPDGEYEYTNETPQGQADNHGMVELNFLGDRVFRMMKKCHLIGTLDDRILIPGVPPPKPVWKKIDMTGPAK